MFHLRLAKRALVAFVSLAVIKSPLSTLHAVISDYAVAPVSKTISHVPVLSGSDAVMPCRTAPPRKNDSLLLVVWYRDDNPVYSYDTRLAPQAAHWVEEEYAGRARWLASPASGLRLRQVRPRDRAIYRCRVDFYVSQTHNYRIALDVVELPSPPIIFDEFGKEISGIAGPYLEGEGFKLVCTVVGAYPSPRVRWLQGDAVLASAGNMDWTFAEEYKPPKSCALFIRNATRSLLMSTFTCSADNTLLAPPIKTSVQIDLYLKPQSVEIMSKDQPISAGRKAELLCRSTGARPPATITWWLGDTKMDAPTEVIESKEASGSESLLKWTPLKEQNGKMLTCRAEHPKLNRLSIESKQILNVHYMPDVEIHFGDKVNSNDIEEGDDIYFGCKVDANPRPYKIVWEHNGVQLQNNPANGIIITGYVNLAIRKVSRTHAGLYACIASNVEGDSRSQELQVQIFYKPFCKRKQKSIIGAALQEPTTVSCEVDAFPAPETFEWTLNGSAGSTNIKNDRFTVDAKKGRSVLSYTPLSASDYGTLACHAVNLAGKQTAPCLYTLLPATIPDPPRNCTVHNFTDQLLHVSCLPGYDGGLHTTYVVEIWRDEVMLRNASDDAAVWKFRRLGSSFRLQLIIFALNARGMSDSIKLTVDAPAKLPEGTTAEEFRHLHWMVGILFGAAITIPLVVCVVIFGARAKQRSNQYEAPTLTNEKFAEEKRSSPQNSDDKNPDLIPLTSTDDAPPPDPPKYSAIVATTHLMHAGSGHGLPRSQVLAAPAASGHYVEPQMDFGRSAATAGRVHREIVTTRTPLLSAQQESCV